MMKIMAFSIFTKSGLQRQTLHMQNSSYREATDLRRSPSDAKYNKASGKIRGNEIEFGDLEKFSVNRLK